MCGIFGCVGKCQTLPILINGLELLEYRGYDSAGVAYFKDNAIHVVKKVGKVNVLKNSLDLTQTSNCGIAHTRWATHGRPSEKNCHPHVSGKICLVHNGIIENYSDFKKDFFNNFYSETDSELIAKLIDKNYEKNIKKYLKNNKKNKYISKKIKLNILIKAINECALKMQGSWACAVICEDILDHIFVFKKLSPLIIGKSNKFNLISSDLIAINNIFNKNKIINKNINYFNLNDNEIAVLNKNSIKFFDNNLNLIFKEASKINLSLSENNKDNFEHFMLKEIYETPQIVEETFNSVFNNIDKKLIDDLNNCEKITIIGCGTAYHAGLIGKFYLTNFLDKQVDVQLASEFRYNKQIFSKNEIVIGISQSGETADTIAGIKLAKQFGLKTVVITNVKNSSITNFSDFIIYTEAGAEIGVAATKSFSSQITAFLAAIAKIKFYKNKNDFFANNLINKFHCLCELINNEIKKDDKNENYKNFLNMGKYFFIGRDIDATLSLEGALKLKEISYVHAEGYPAGELKHGTLSLIDKNSMIIATITQKHILEKTLNAVHEAKARGASVLIISQYDLSSHADYFIKLLSDDDLLSPILAMIPIQLLAYHLSKSKGYDPDKPRNLAKSVTVE